MKKIFGFALLISSAAIFAMPSSPSREGKELELAERVILLSRMQFASPSTRHFCRQWEGLCVSSESIELALAFIGRSKTVGSVSVLVDMARFRLDAGLGADYTCYVLAHREEGLRSLRNLNVEGLRERCLQEVSLMRAESRVNFSDVELNYVCADSTFISARANELASAIEGGQLCDPGDF